MGSTSSIGRHLHQHWLDCHIICRIGVSALTSLARIVLSFLRQETNHCLITIVPPGDKSPKLQSSHMQEHPSAATRPTLQGYLSDPSGIDLTAAFIISHHQQDFGTQIMADSAENFCKAFPSSANSQKSSGASLCS